MFCTGTFSYFSLQSSQLPGAAQCVGVWTGFPHTQHECGFPAWAEVCTKPPQVTVIHFHQKCLWDWHSLDCRHSCHSSIFVCVFLCVWALFSWHSISGHGRRSLYREKLILLDHRLKSSQANRPLIPRQRTIRFLTFFTQRYLCLFKKLIPFNTLYNILVVTELLKLYKQQELVDVIQQV